MIIIQAELFLLRRREERKLHCHPQAGLHYHCFSIKFNWQTYLTSFHKQRAHILTSLRRNHFKHQLLTALFYVNLIGGFLPFKLWPNKLNCYKYAFFGHIIHNGNQIMLIYLLFTLLVWFKLMCLYRYTQLKVLNNEKRGGLTVVIRKVSLSAVHAEIFKQTCSILILWET